MTDILRPKVSLPMDRDEIKKYLPHRAPMLFLDKVTAIGEQSIEVQSYANPEADYFKGHFPELPIQPGVLIVEAVAQAGALLVLLTDGLPADMFMGFSSIDSAKFKKPVFPGANMVITVKIVGKRLPFYRFSGRVSVDEKLVASIDFKAAQMKFDSN